MKETVFLVEPETAACQLATRCLEEAGFSVRTFSAATVIEEAEQSQPSLLLVADALPDSTGLDLCTRLRHNVLLAETPVVLLNSDPSEEGRVAGFQAYRYQMFQFTQAGIGDISTNSVEFVYRRRVSGRLHLILGGGPAFSKVARSDNANGLQLNATAQASLQYRFNRSTLRLSYNRLETTGFGVFAGGNSNIVQASISRAISRSVQATVYGGYARVTRVEVSSARTAANPYSYGFASVAVQRRLGRRLNAFASYQFNDQSSFCGASATCTAGVRQHIALIGFDWNIRPIRLE